MHLIRRGFLWLLTLLGIVVFLAPYTPLREVQIFSQAIALDKPIAWGAGLFGLLGLILGLARHRTPRLFAACLILVLLFGGRVYFQGWKMGNAPSGNAKVVALSWNTEQRENLLIRGEADYPTTATLLAPIVNRYHPQVIALAETAFGDRVASGLGGYRNITAANDDMSSLLLSNSFAAAGGYTADNSAPAWSGVIARPAVETANHPIIVAAHLQQPSVGQLGVDEWRTQIKFLQNLCSTNKYVYIVGDMNSTLNNLGGTTLGSCADVGVEHDAGAASTWPTWLPRAMGVPIDRAMVGAGYSAKDSSFKVLDGFDDAQSDHRPVLSSAGL